LQSPGDQNGNLKEKSEVAPLALSTNDPNENNLNDMNDIKGLFHINRDDQIFFYEKMHQSKEILLSDDELARLTKILLNTRFVIADFGNSCWTYKHFSEEIQTRQYRSPEVILGAGYDTSADIWSLACMIFELLTGDFLFDPQPNENYSRDEDHLALIIELLGKPPLSQLQIGKNYDQFFTPSGELQQIPSLIMISLHQLLTQKYLFTDEVATTISDFLIPMLIFHPEMRASATECLNHPWMMPGLEDGANQTEDVDQEYVQDSTDYNEDNFV